MMRLLRFAVLLVIGCLAANQAVAQPCVISATQLADVGKLNPPITRNAQGKLVRAGRILGGEDVQAVCETRRFYDLLLAREAEGKSVTIGEIAEAGYVAGYLTHEEAVRVSNDVYKVEMQN